MKRLLPFVILIVLILAGAVAVTFLFNPEKSKAELARYLTQRLQQKVLINKVELKMLPPQLHVGGLTIFRSNDTPLFQAESIDAPFAWRPLLKGQLAPRELTITRWTLSMKRAANGSWQWQEGNRTASNLTSRTSWPLEKINLEQGQVSAVDAWGNGDGLQWRAIQGTIRPGPRLVTLQGDLSGAGPISRLTLDGQGAMVSSSSDWNADLRVVEGSRECLIKIKSSGTGLVLHGESSAWNVESVWALAKFAARLRGIPASFPASLLVEHWKTDLSISAVATQFSHTGMISGGATEIKGTTQPRANDLQISATLAVKDIPMEAVPNFSGLTSGLQGKLTAMATLDLQVSTRTFQDLNGKGTVYIHDGRYRFPTTALARLKKAKTLAYFQKKYPEFEQRGFAFQRFRVSGEAMNGYLTIQDSLLEAQDLRAALVGRVDLEKSGLDLYSRLQLLEKSPALKNLIPTRYVYGSAGRGTIQPIYGRLQGTPAEWSIKATPSGKIPAPTQKQLQRSLSAK